jgi:hypothetical protein
MNSRMGRMLAGGLLRQIGGYRAESLIGDLTEEYAQGRSGLWYWRQVLLAVLTSYLRHLRIHGIRFLGAIALGAGGVEACIALIQWLSDLVWRKELAIFGAALSAADLQSLELILFWGAWTPLTAVIYGLLGRLIAASHSRHPKWVVGIFISFILISRLPWTVRLFLVDTGDTRYLSYPMQDLIATLLCVAGAWLGCAWHLRAERRLNSINRMSLC